MEDRRPGIPDCPRLGRGRDQGYMAEEMAEPEPEPQGEGGGKGWRFVPKSHLQGRGTLGHKWFPEA